MACRLCKERVSRDAGRVDRPQAFTVLSIIASPSLSSDVRHKATSLLRQLHSAYSNDKNARHASSGTPASLAPLTDAEAQTLESELENGKLDDRVESTPVRTDHVLRVHGIYMDRRREFEIRVGQDGKLAVYDAKEGKPWGS